MAAAALSHRKVPMRLMCTTFAKKSPAIGPFLPSTRPAPTTPAQFTRRLIPPIVRACGFHRRVHFGFGGHITSDEHGVLAESRRRCPARSLLHVQNGNLPPLRHDVLGNRVAQAGSAARDDRACILNLHWSPLISLAESRWRFQQDPTQLPPAARPGQKAWFLPTTPDCYPSISTASATASPPPIHRDAIPRFWPRRFRRTAGWSGCAHPWPRSDGPARRRHHLR